MDSGVTNPKNWKEPFSSIPSVKDAAVDGIRQVYTLATKKENNFPLSSDTQTYFRKRSAPSAMGSNYSLSSVNSNNNNSNNNNNNNNNNGNNNSNNNNSNSGVLLGGTLQFFNNIGSSLNLNSSNSNNNNNNSINNNSGVVSINNYNNVLEEGRDKEKDGKEKDREKDKEKKRTLRKSGK